MPCVPMPYPIISHFCLVLSRSRLPRVMRSAAPASPWRGWNRRRHRERHQADACCPASMTGVLSALQIRLEATRQPVPRDAIDAVTETGAVGTLHQDEFLRHRHPDEGGLCAAERGGRRVCHKEDESRRDVGEALTRGTLARAAQAGRAKLCPLMRLMFMMPLPVPLPVFVVRPPRAESALLTGQTIGTRGAATDIIFLKNCPIFPSARGRCPLSCGQ